MQETSYHNPLQPSLPKKPGDRIGWGRLYGSSKGLAISAAATAHPGFTLVITGDTPGMFHFAQELRFYLGESSDTPILTFPDWETLPYDIFSPHQDIISERLRTLYALPQLKRGILLVPAATVLQRICPVDYLQGNSLLLGKGDKLDIDTFRTRLDKANYRNVSQVMEHGEYAVRGSLLDVYPMGSAQPYRIDLFDDEVESIRTFDPETQRTTETVASIELLPAREFPLNEQSIKLFRQRFREKFSGDPQASRIYRDVTQGIASTGIEYYLPLFFEQTSSLIDYLPDNTQVLLNDSVTHAVENFLHEVDHRYEQRRYDIERPLLEPCELYLRSDELYARIKKFAQIKLQDLELPPGTGRCNYATQPPPSLTLDAKAAQPAHALLKFIAQHPGARILFATESAGRREILLDILRNHDIRAESIEGWHDFIQGSSRSAITVAPLEHGLWLEQPDIAIITETQLFGQQVLQRRRRQQKSRETENVVRNLTELEIGMPVVHEEHGVGRYLGLQKLAVGDIESEFLMLEYAGGDKLYVPVASLHLISRYSGMAPENAPLHKLGSGHWEKARRKAIERIRDVAAELLAIYAKRESRQRDSYQLDLEQYAMFAAGFPFEETPDQAQAIENVLRDMAGKKPMDRLVCGDVGFGKTEVAMRAAFVAVQGDKQVAVLVPTTLLAQQHWENFQDRFADWPVKIESLSRFRSKKEQDAALKGLADGKVDIVIGTHKLLQDDVRFRNLGLVIMDEEHRFGVRQKEKFKALRAEVDMLTLTATPIPRTLNMSLSGIRDLSIIATPPARRLAVKTFVSEWNDTLIQEACQREIMRGGQLYFLHNNIDTIEKTARKIEALVPEAKVNVAHGQMRERDLEHIMSDFYHQRFNVLVCTTIIETGIDIPSANTIIIDHADHFGLAQLYQLRGRVGRSHHRAYAYLITPPRRTLTADASKRLEALESIEELGAGFTLATHDMEIRGAGELLGEEQSGQMQEIGFTMYMDLLERAVADLKAGRNPDLERPLDQGTEVELAIPALLPEDYLPDVHARLTIYKRIASAATFDELRELQVEMIDRFGLLPEQTKSLFRISELKLKAQPLGIRKIEMGPAGGRITFVEKPAIEPMRVIQLMQSQPRIYQLDSQQRLKINHPLPDADARFKAVEYLIDALAACRT